MAFGLRSPSAVYVATVASTTVISSGLPPENTHKRIKIKKKLFGRKQ